MFLRWFPWRYVVSRVARARGLLDPIKVLSRRENLGQPLEVKEPSSCADIQLAAQLDLALLPMP